MLSFEEARKIAQDSYPEGRIELQVGYRDLYLFQIFDEDPNEGEMDPFYSVDMNTGEFRDFSVLTDGDFDEIERLFILAKTNRRGGE